MQTIRQPYGVRRYATTASYYEFQTDSGKTFRICCPTDMKISCRR